MYESAQMYLETILVLRERNGNVRAVDIANEMNFSKPSVSVALKSLKQNGYVSVDGNSLIHLTDEGEVIARSIYDRHVTLEKFLVSIGVDIETAREDACKVEHDISEETFQKLKQFMMEK